jgi:hypothetical protein
MLRQPGTAFVVVAVAAEDALHEVEYFVDRLLAEHVILAGLVPHRAHPALADLTPPWPQLITLPPRRTPKPTS